MKYVYQLKTAPSVSKYATVMIIMGVIALPLIVFDIHEMGVIIYALSGVR